MLPRPNGLGYCLWIQRSGVRFLSGFLQFLLHFDVIITLLYLFHYSLLLYSIYFITLYYFFILILFILFIFFLITFLLFISFLIICSLFNFIAVNLSRTQCIKTVEKPSKSVAGGHCNSTKLLWFDAIIRVTWTGSCNVMHRIVGLVCVMAISRKGAWDYI